MKGDHACAHVHVHIHAHTNAQINTYAHTHARTYTYLFCLHQLLCAELSISSYLSYSTPEAQKERGQCGGH